MKVAIIIVSLTLAMAVGLSGCCTPVYLPATGPAPSPKESPPASPSNLRAEAISYDTIELWWTDNSANEDGFRIYRDNKLIERVRSNSTMYQDIDLEAATIYSYTVKAYNAVGESPGCSTSLRTPNPPITVRLDRVGVYDNGEHYLRGEDGEVYVYVVVSDGKKTTEAMRFPKREGQHYKLAKNETVDVGATIFSVDEVGDSLTMTVVGYESDGGDFEPLVYEVLTGAMLSSTQVAGAVMEGLLEAFGTGMEEAIASFFGTEDDWLGSYEQTWSSNWGIGRYTDIACEEEDSTLGLRLWFTIENPMEPLPEPQQFSLVTAHGVQVACPKGWKSYNFTDPQLVYWVYQSDTIGIAVGVGPAEQEMYDAPGEEGYSDCSSIRTTVGGYVAYKVEFVFTHDDVEVKSTYFSIQRGDEACVILFWCDVDELEAYEPIFEYVLDSFKFLE